MAEYRQIHVQIWKDSWFLDLPPEHKLLFVYLFSNERASVSGIYDLSIKVMAFETDLEPGTIRAALATFAEADKVLCENGIVWVKNLRRYNASSSVKVLERIRRDLELLADCPLKAAYIEQWGIPPPPKKAVYLPPPPTETTKIYPIPDPEIPYPETESEQEQEQEHETEQDQETEQETEQEPLGATRAPPEVMPDPTTLTVQQIKALELSKSQWLAMSRAESKGKNRATVMAHCKRMLDQPHPAILAFQEATGKYPRKPLWPGIIRVVGDKPDNVEFWRKVCFNWNACGYNPLGAQGMLENYLARTIPTTKKGKGTRRQQSAPADFARSEYARPADTPTRAPPTEAERIWSEVVAMWRGSYPQLAEIRAIPGDAADGIMLAGNRQVVEPVKARLMERLAGWVDDAAGRPLEIRWVGDTGEVG